MWLTQRSIKGGTVSRFLQYMSSSSSSSYNNNYTDQSGSSAITRRMLRGSAEGLAIIGILFYAKTKASRSYETIFLTCLFSSNCLVRVDCASTGISG